MTNRPAPASSAQKASSHQSIEPPSPGTSRTGGLEWSPKGSVQISTPLACTTRSAIPSARHGAHLGTGDRLDQALGLDLEHRPRRAGGAPDGGEPAQRLVDDRPDGTLVTQGRD